MGDRLGSKALKAFSWDFGGQFARQGVSFVISVILARLLNPEDFGTLALINVILIVSNTFMDFGLGSALVQKKIIDEEHYSSVFLINLLMGVFLAIILVAISDLIAQFYNQPKLSIIAKIMSLNFLINSFGIVQSSILTKELNFKLMTQSRLYAYSLGGILGVLLAFLNFGVWSLVLQGLVSNAIFTGLIWFKVRWKPKLVFKIEKIKELFEFGFRMFLAGVLDSIVSSLDSLLIGKIFSPYELGQYFRAKSFLAMFIQYTSSSLSKIYFPLLSEIQNDRERVRAVVKKSFSVMSLMVFLILGNLFINARSLIIFLFGAKWEPSVSYFEILLIGSFCIPLGGILGSVLPGMGNSKTHLRVYIVANVYIVLNLVIGLLISLQAFLIGLIGVNIMNLHLNIRFATKELEMKANEFYILVFSYVTLTSVLILILNYFSTFYENIHVIFSALISSFVFSSGFVGLAVLFKLDGVIETQEILSKIFNKLKVR